MFTIEFSFIAGMMLGVEFVTKEQSGGTSAFILDLLILRIGFYHEDE